MVWTERISIYLLSRWKYLPLRMSKKVQRGKTSELYITSQLKF